MIKTFKDIQVGDCIYYFTNINYDGGEKKGHTIGKLKVVKKEAFDTVSYYEKVGVVDGREVYSEKTHQRYRFELQDCKTKEEDELNVADNRTDYCDYNNKYYCTNLEELNDIVQEETGRMQNYITALVSEIMQLNNEAFIKNTID